MKGIFLPRSGAPHLAREKKGIITSGETEMGRWN